MAEDDIVENELNETVCIHCGGTGVVVTGEFDDIGTKKCICQSDTEPNDQDRE